MNKVVVVVAVLLLTAMGVGYYYYSGGNSGLFQGRVMKAIPSKVPYSITGSGYSGYSGYSSGGTTNAEGRFY